MAGNSYLTVDEGVDKNIASYQRSVDAATVETYKYVEDEPFMATYTVVGQTALGISTANSHIFQIMAGGTLRVGLKRLVLEQVANATTTARIQLQAWALTTAGTGGTALTPRALDPLSATVGATVMTLPSSKGAENSIRDQRHHLIHTTATTVGVERLVWEWGDGRHQGIWITAGVSNGIAIKCVPSDASATFRFSLTFVEASY